MPRKIEVSHKTIIFATFFLLFLWFLYYIRDLIFDIFVGILIMAILNPFVTRLSKYKIPRGISTFLAYALAFAAIGITIAIIVPPLIEQTTSFVNGAPTYLERVGLPSSYGEQIGTQLLSQLGSLPASIAKITLSLFSNVVSVLTVLFFAFYFLVGREKLDDQLGFFFGESKRKDIGKTIDELEKKLGGWARGELSLMFLVGLANYIGLLIIGIPFALPLAILAGLLEIIPYIGPIIAAIPAIIIGFGISPVIGLAVAGLALLIQQLESYILIPRVMEKSVGVNPVITLFSLAVGFRVAGIVGMIISIPIIISLQVVLSKYTTLTSKS